MVEAVIDPKLVAAQRAAWNPWWIWLLFALWVFSTVFFTVWSLLPRRDWQSAPGRWFFTLIDWIWSKFSAQRYDEEDNEPHQYHPSTYGPDAKGTSNDKPKGHARSKVGGVVSVSSIPGWPLQAAESVEMRDLRNRRASMVSYAQAERGDHNERGRRISVADSGWRKLEVP
jgi:hypothetical protein